MLSILNEINHCNKSISLPIPALSHAIFVDIPFFKEKIS